MSRWIVVDDTNGTGIAYGGVWQVSAGMVNNMPVSGGPPLYNTLHGTHSNASISYTFKGSIIVVVGSQFSATPQWTCSIDGQLVPTTPNVSNGDNQHLFTGSVNDGIHNIVLDISATEDEPFWFDYFQVLPSTDMGLDQADVIYGWDDSLVHCDSDWDPMQIGGMTMKKGSTMSFDFNGVSLSWFGVYNSSHHKGPASATYSVDGETPIPFSLENVSSDNAPVLSNQPFFHTSRYPAGQHRLEVTYQGNPGATPLTLQHLIVQDSPPNAPVSTLTAVSTVTAIKTATISSTTSTSQPSQPSSSSHSRVIGSIVGGAIGGFFFLAFLALVFLFLRRCTSRRKREGHPEGAFRHVIEPYTHIPPSSSSGYDPLPGTTSKQSLLVGHRAPAVSRAAPRRSIIQSLMGRFTRATVGSSNSNSENSTLLPLASSRHTRTRTSGSWVVVHEDSGVRIFPELPHINTDVIEIPPTYSVE